MPSPDEVIPVAFALHNSPRRYALLVGSGISRDTGILTAGEITDDLIRQIAELHHKKIGDQKPVEWYQKQFGSSPTFTGLFDRLAKSKDDQVAILRQYFEPVDGDGKPQRIEPTAAHQTIARLVRDGIVSVILTPNFDNLLETAIEKETGKVPVVITPDSKPEKMEVAGDYCRIIKMNGSFPDTALKLTPADLAQYEPALAAYLDRIFSEYGLVICGWSGEHDTGLVDILTEVQTRRFAIFWCSREIPEKIPETIRTKLHLSTLGITSANEFFGDLESQIAMLSRHERKTPLTVERAIQNIKAALRNPRPDLILPDLLHDETDKILAEVNRTDVIPEGIIDGKACFRNRLNEIERTAAPLAAMVATIAYYDTGEYSALITEILDQLINISGIENFPAWQSLKSAGVSAKSQEKVMFVRNQKLRLYPALLVVYSSGISATYRKNFNSLSAIVEKPRIRLFDYFDPCGEVPLQEIVNIWQILYGTGTEPFISDIYLQKTGRSGNIYAYFFGVVQRIVRGLISNPHYFEAAFDTFELLKGFSYLNIPGREPMQNRPLSSRLIVRYRGEYFEEPGWIQIGEPRRTIRVDLPQSVRSYFHGIGPTIQRSDFFGGDLQRFESINKKYSQFLEVEPLKTGIETVPEHWNAG